MEYRFENRFGNALRRSGTGHTYLAPHPLLRPYVAHYTIFRPEEAPTNALVILPDASGCFVLELIEAGFADRAFGASTKASQVSANAGSPYPLLFVEFYPGGLCRFTREKQSGLADLVLSLGDVNRPFLARATEALEQCGGDLDAFFQSLDGILLDSLCGREPPSALSEAVALLRAANGALSVRELSARTYYSERHLNRLFTEHLGLGAKQFGRLLRVNRAARVLGSGAHSLSVLAQDTGYFDQSHFIRDFREVCGVTPREYLANLSEFYNEPIKL